MLKGIIGFLIAGVAVCALAQSQVETRTKIAVIDTGLNVTPQLEPYLCKSGHISFVDSNPLIDTHGHGSNVAGLIAENLNPEKHCLLIIKFYDQAAESTTFRLVRVSIDYAVAQKVSYINMSLGGLQKSSIEYALIKNALAEGVRITVAAGNASENLDYNCFYYPACYKFTGALKSRFRVVGSSTGLFSNKGKAVTHLEDGLLKGSPILSGTSQATAIHTGKWVKANTEYQERQK